jgi:hypothetical protein
MADDDNQIVPSETPTPQEMEALAESHLFFSLLPKPTIDLTPEQRKKAETLHTAFAVLGPAAGGALVCPGNQVDLPDSMKCPYSAKCEYLKALKAPAGELCPLESRHIEDKFLGWCQELGKNPLTLTESERAFIGELVWISVQEYRCASIVSKGEQARLTQLSPKDVHPDTLEPISWEREIHSNVQRLDQLGMQRRLLLKDWMLTPEQKWRRDKASKLSNGRDLSTVQSARADRLRKLGRRDEEEDDIIDAEVEDLPPLAD